MGLWSNNIIMVEEILDFLCLVFSSQDTLFGKMAFFCHQVNHKIMEPILLDVLD